MAWMLRGCAGAWGLAVVTAQGALAQDPGPEGIRLGAFVATPSIETSLEYNDNVLEEPNTEIDSFIFRIKPEFDIESDFSRHAVAFSAGLEHGNFLSSSADNYTEYFAETRGVLDFTREVRMSGGIRYRRGSEGRDDDDSPSNAAEPTEFDDYTARLRLDAEGPILRVAGFGRAQRLDFDEVSLIGGGVRDEDDRDRDVISGGAEAGYEFLRGYEAFARAEARRIDYDEPLFGDADNRDGDGLRLLGGVNVALTRLIEASVLGGYETREFDSSLYDDYDDFTFEALIDWNVTRLTTLRFGADRRISETTVDDASHRVDSSVLLGVDHELRRNLTLEAALGYEERDFIGVPRTDDRVTAAIGLEWIPMRRIAVEAEYRFTTQDSNDAESEFDLNQFFVSLRYQF